MNYFPVKMKAACQIGGFFCSDYFSFFYELKCIR